MNIVIIGPGNDENRFGRQFVNLAKKDLHTVHEFSFRTINESPQEIAIRFKEFISEIDTINVMLYNVMAGHYPGNISNFEHTHPVNFEEWNDTFICNVSLPHMFSLSCLSKMNESSSIIFMTSTGSYMPPKDLNLSKYAGYFGSKSAQNHLMWALSDHNDKKSTVCSIAPHFPYEDKVISNKVISSTYNKIINITSADSGKIFTCCPPLGNIFVEELRK